MLGSAKNDTTVTLGEKRRQKLERFGIRFVPNIILLGALTVSLRCIYISI